MIPAALTSRDLNDNDLSVLHPPTDLVGGETVASQLASADHLLAQAVVNYEAEHIVDFPRNKNYRARPWRGSRSRRPGAVRKRALNRFKRGLRLPTRPESQQGRRYPAKAHRGHRLYAPVRKDRAR
jgi:hypothetical protein